MSIHFVNKTIKPLFNFFTCKMISANAIEAVIITCKCNAPSPCPVNIYKIKKKLCILLKRPSYLAQIKSVIDITLIFL